MTTYILFFITPYDFYFKIVSVEHEVEMLSLIENEKMTLSKQGHKDCKAKYYKFCSFRLEDYPCKDELVLGNCF